MRFFLGKLDESPGLLIALGVAAVVGLLFGLSPDFDLKLAGLFFDPSGPGFYRTELLALRPIYTALTTLVAAPPFVALAMKLVWPRRPLLVSGRAIILMIATLALGPELITNTLLKDHWGRPRPIDVSVFGGDEHFVAWWDPRGDCPKNCSFVAGEPSGAFWTLAPAALVPPAWRALAYGAAIAFGAGVGFLRIASGAHFFSDVVFAGVFTFLIIWVAHGLLYRWPATRIGDEAVERTIERAVLRGHDTLARLFARGRSLW